MFKKKTEWKNITAKKEYLQNLITSNKMKPITYDMSQSHQLGQFITHPKFGLGFIQGKIGENKIRVFFEQFEKVLLQNWITLK